MVHNQDQLLQEAQALVTELLQNKLSKSIRFHTLTHTQDVVRACELLADALELPAEDRLPLLLAAWFHDTGYIQGKARGHEERSRQMAVQFLEDRQASPELIEKVTGCIKATRIPQTPTNLSEKIICDADLFHLGTDYFREKSRLLRDELEALSGKEIPKKTWRKANIRFLEGHRYFTAYGKEKLEPVKQQHILALQSKNHDEVKKEKDREKEKTRANEDAVNEELKEIKLRREKEKEADRSIATVFRIMAQNHSALSQMADSKANILISVNSIILSIIISVLFEKLQTDPNMQIPVGILVAVCVAAIVFGILATRPNVSSGTFTRDDIANKRTNLLFFGNFHNMSLEDYNWGMTEMLGDKYYMNASMIKDNYFLGVVLAKKYRYLRIAYNIFMYGIILAMLAFGISFLMPETTEVYSPG